MVHGEPDALVADAPVNRSGDQGHEARPLSRALQVLLAVTPLLLTPLFFYALSEGSLGGGEKDVLWSLPWLLWSVAFAACALVLITKSWPLRRWALRAAFVATGSLIGLWLLVLAASHASLI